MDKKNPEHPRQGTDITDKSSFGGSVGRSPRVSETFISFPRRARDYLAAALAKDSRPRCEVIPIRGGESHDG
jgi:hypothetical protein